MDGIDIGATLRQVAERMAKTEERAELEDLLDRVEYLLEVIDPAIQDTAYTLIEQLRQRLGYG